MKRGGFLGRLRRNERGNVLIIVAASLPLTIGSAAMTTDMIQWVVWKRELQRQADSGALAGAFALTQSKTVSSTVTADLAKNADANLNVTETIDYVVNTGPASGAFANNPRAVRVELQTSHKLPFSSLFLTTAPTIRAEATALIIDEGEYCADATDPDDVVGISIGGNATIDLGCGMISNSTGSNGINAVNAFGSAAVKASPIAAVGGLSPDSHYASGTIFHPYSPPLPDPFASLPDPIVPSAACSSLTVSPSQTQSPAAGCYSSMTIKGTVTLNGTYIIDGGSFKVNSGAVIIGTNVTIILTSRTASTNPSSVATLDINGGATINLSAPTTGAFANILIYQDRRANDSGTEKINGNASSYFQGAIYMPSRALEFTGGSGTSTNCIQLVARRISFMGNGNIVNSCPSGYDNSFTGRRVRLVA